MLLMIFWAAAVAVGFWFMLDWATETGWPSANSEMHIVLPVFAMVAYAVASCVPASAPYASSLGGLYLVGLGYPLVLRFNGSFAKWNSDVCAARTRLLYPRHEPASLDGDGTEGAGLNDASERNGRRAVWIYRLARFLEPGFPMRERTGPTI